MPLEKPMIYFPDQLEFRDAGMRGHSRIFRLTAPFSYISSRGVVVVPAGFDTDGASIPRVFWSILDPFGPYFKAAVIHDWLYSPHNRRFTRAQSDDIFKEAMYNNGLDWFRREAIYRAVRLGGWRNYKGKP
jgi:hypothetical protein